MATERRGLRIAVDARELGGKPTGVGRYLAHLLERWAILPEAAPHHFVLYTPAPLPWLPDARPGQPGSRGATAPRFVQRLVAGAPGTAWEQVRLLRAVKADGHPDVFFAPGYSAPVLLRCPIVLTIHDLSFYARPEWFAWRERMRRQVLARWSSRIASVILTVSAFSRGEIARYLCAGDDPRVCVVPHGSPDPRATPPAGASRQPLVLFVGSLFTRRRLPDLITAFATVAARHQGARLAIVGDDRTFPPQPLAPLAAAAGLGERVSIRSYVSDAELDALYASASVFVFLSEYEGFGLTPLEALASGIPIVVADTPVSREVYGEAARYVRIGDIEALAEVVLELIGDEHARDALVREGRSTLARYSWDRAARITLAALEEAAEPR